MIHVPGAIQPHGALLAALADEGLISHISANLGAILGQPADAMFGRLLADVVGEDTARRLLKRDASNAADLDHGIYLPGPEGRALHVRAHRSGRRISLDIEPTSPDANQTTLIDMAQSGLERLRGAASRAELCDRAVHVLRAITGFDRVIFYRFRDDQIGEVIAEARAARVDPLLGLRYPAFNIPPQARRLYLRQRVGAIADSSYLPVPLLSDSNLDDGAPLDLTLSALRSVSPVHRQFMRTMRTAASLTVAIANGEDLSGMIVCHHETPRIAEPALRAVADIIGQAVSLLLQRLDEADVDTQRLARRSILSRLIDRLTAPVALPDALAAAEAELLALVDAERVLLLLSGVARCLGRTPPMAAAERALAVMEPLAGDDIVAVNDLGLRHPELGVCTRNGSGALLLMLGQGSGDAIMWFRPEQGHTAPWGGTPDEQPTFDAGSLDSLPRSPSAAWKQSIKGHAAPWTAANRALARELRGAIRAEMARRTQAALVDSEQRFLLLAEHSGDVVVLTDLNGTRRYVSPAAAWVLGRSPEAMVGRHALEFVHPEDQPRLLNAINDMRTGTPEVTETYRYQRPDGAWIWIETRARVRDGDGSRADYVAVLRDVTERKVAEFKLQEALEAMARMAATDGLTGLANRRHFDEAVERVWRRCARDRTPLSVLLLDADRFKLFNDRYGHLAGDDCLRAIAFQLDAVARGSGDLAARYGGEEFVLLMPHRNQNEAAQVADKLGKLIRNLNILHEANDPEGIVTASIGAATTWPGHPANSFGSVDGLMLAADTALYQAKRGGRNQAVVVAYEQAMSVQSWTP